MFAYYDSLSTSCSRGSKYLLTPTLLLHRWYGNTALCNAKEINKQESLVIWSARCVLWCSVTFAQLIMWCDRITWQHRDFNAAGRPPLGDVNAVGTSSQLMTPVCSSHHFSGQSHANTHTHTHMHAHKHTNIYTQIYAHARRDAETKGNPYLCTCNIGIRIISHTKIYIYLYCIHIHIWI